MIIGKLPALWEAVQKDQDVFGIWVTSRPNVQVDSVGCCDKLLVIWY
jgi:hypothetical protein